jgi:hypothetical protein
MNELRPYLPYLILAAICGTASVAIVFLALMAILGRGGGSISDPGMMAIAVMAFAPSVTGIVIASHLPRTQPAV